MLNKTTKKVKLLLNSKLMDMIITLENNMINSKKFSYHKA